MKQLDLKLITGSGQVAVEEHIVTSCIPCSIARLLHAKRMQSPLFFSTRIAYALSLPSLPAVPSPWAGSLGSALRALPHTWAIL